LPGEHEVLPLEVPYQQGAEADARALGLGEAAHDQFLRRLSSPWPWVTVGAGAVLVGISALSSSDPVDLEERTRLVRAHNGKLRVTPLIQPAGGGISLSGRF
jgi:hypothetical protein